jgi:LPXTG-site transpeptidase (sortase) family protein
MYRKSSTVQKIVKASIIGVSTGVVVLLASLLLLYTKYNAASIENTIILPPISSGPLAKQQPTSIYIAKINKDLPIQAALVHNNEWDMFDNAVAWLSTSAVPGDGNVILYAHNWTSLWGDLYKLVPGDKIEISQNTIKHTYIVIESRAINPTDVDVILSTDNQLTLYTCEGTFDQKRRVVFAKPL